MPLNRNTIEEELESSLHHVAMVDRSQSGRVEIGGKDGLDLLHRLSTNDLLACKPGSHVGTVFTTDKGRILDYVRVAVLESRVIAITSASQAVPFIEWVNKYCIMEDVRLTDLTPETGMITLIGPEAPSVISAIFGCEVLPSACLEVDGPHGRVQILGDRTFGIDIIDLLGNKDHVERIRGLLESRVASVSVDGYEAVRIVHGIPAYGAELIETFNPYDVGLRSVISFTKGCYLGQEVIARIDTYQKIQRKLIGLLLQSNPPTSGTRPVLLKDSREVGQMTSASSYPIAAGYVGLGVVRTHEVEPGDTLWVESQGIRVPAKARQIPIIT